MANYEQSFEDNSGTFSAVYNTLNSANNYSYDEIGNLIKDNKEEIASVEWSATGMIRKITRTGTSLKSDLEFVYGVGGERMYKIVKPRTGSGLKTQKDWVTTIYANAGGGSVFAVYELKYEELIANQKVKDKLFLKDLYLYSETRLEH